MRKRLVLIGLVLSLAAFLSFPNSSVGQRTFGSILTSTTTPRREAVASPCASGKEADLPLPSKFLPNKLPEFQAQVKTFLTSGRYKNLNWCEDKALRDTGPFVNGVSYGVHPSVKIYYSPSVINWLLNNKTGQLIPDGAMIVKEQYTPPVAQYQLQPSPPPPRGWTIMIKDAKGSKDGWYWGEFWSTQCVDNNNPPFAVPYAGFGLYCLRCHASAEKEHTFTYERNLKGFPDEPDSYFVDLSWTTLPPPHPAAPPPPCSGSADSDIGEATAGHTAPPRDAAEQLQILKQTAMQASTSSADPRFVAFFNSISPVPVGSVRKIPGETFDHIFPQPLGSASPAP